MMQVPKLHSVAPRGLHIRRILLQCLLVITPMIASSLTIIYIVYTNLVSGDCVSSELCPSPKTINTTSGAYYYIDFPAARLAFISSGSATISFALIGLLMAMYSYSNADTLFRASRIGDHDALPSPYQMNVVLKILNAEIVVLWELGLSKVKRVFWKLESVSDPVAESPRILSMGLLVLTAGVLTRYVTETPR